MDRESQTGQPAVRHIAARSAAGESGDETPSPAACQRHASVPGTEAAPGSRQPGRPRIGDARGPGSGNGTAGVLAGVVVALAVVGVTAFMVAVLSASAPVVIAAVLGAFATVLGAIARVIRALRDR